jgi:hypothetical protein
MLTRAATILVLGSLTGTIGSPAATAQHSPYCSDLQRVVALAMTKQRFAPIAGKPRDGNFLDTSFALTGWTDCSLYGAGTYTCDSAQLDSAQAAVSAQADILQNVKTCLGEEWSEAIDRSTPSYVVLHHAVRPVSITLSTDQKADGKHLVHLIVFVRRSQAPS